MSKTQEILTAAFGLTLLAGFAIWFIVELRTALH